MTIQGLVGEVAPLLHEGKYVEAGKKVLEFSGNATVIREKSEAEKYLLALLYDLLDNDDYELAAKMLWPPAMFTAEPGYTRRNWKALRQTPQLMLMGAASTSKSYSTGVFYFLDWVRDPMYTTVKVVGPSKQHLEDNLFSHLVNLHQSATLPMPGQVGELFIGMNTRNRRGSISGVVVPLGTKGAGRLQGVKRFNRPKAHPKFGELSRTRILLDEAEKIPEGIWADIDNIMSTMTGDQGSIVTCAFNPQDPNSIVGQNCEPEGGWDTIDPDVNFRWKSKRGWTVLRLDGEQCENVKQGKVIYVGLQTKEGLKRLAASSGGRESAGYYTFGRALYPSGGRQFTVIPASSLIGRRARVTFIDRPLRVLGGDVALEGTDKAFTALGLFGLASAIQRPPSLAHPKGEIVYFQDEHGRARPRYVLFFDSLINLLNGDTPHMSGEVKRVAMDWGVQPLDVMLDRTGNGAGVHDTLKSVWSPDVQGVNFTSNASSVKVFEEDSQLPVDMYWRIQSELWFAFKRWLEHGAIYFSPDIDTTKLFQQLTGRRYKTGKQSKVESKPDYMSRDQNESPNEADSCMLALHGVRVTHGIVLSVVKDSVDHDTLSVAMGGSVQGFTGITDKWDDIDD